jgi:hypothetical protein
MKIIITFFFLSVLGFSQVKENEVEAYLRKVKAGEAGQNPKDQALARSGDERAMARMRMRAAMNEINAELSSNKITPEIAEARRARAQASLDSELIAIETREMQQDNQRELQRIRQELERTRQLKRNR